MTIFSPIYSLGDDLLKWRLTYEGGHYFIDTYLKKLSSRETDADFISRKEMSYCPAFAKMGINEIKNSIANRLHCVLRKNESSPSYMQAIERNVDNAGNSMNYFIGNLILTELLIMGEVAVCVDMPTIDIPSETYNLADSLKFKPYLYYYTREQISDYSYDSTGNLIKITLEDTLRQVKYLKMAEGVLYEEYTWKDSEGNKLSKPTLIKEIHLNIPKIPVVHLKISSSLLKDVADYQIALLNICSSDINFIHRANFPLYVEQSNPNDPGSTPGEIKIGPTKGRRIPKGTEFPQYIAPPTDCIKASMEKQEQIKLEIRQLMMLSLSNLTTARKSAESKQVDSGTVETGLSCIAFELCSAEIKIAELWNLFEGKSTEKISIIYPTTYTLKSNDETQAHIKQLIELSKTINSATFRKESNKEIARLVFETTLSAELLQKIYSEISNTEINDTNPEDIRLDAEAGLVSMDFASKLRGYPSGEVEKAKTEHAERLARIAMAQSSSGVKDTSTGTSDNPNGSVRDLNKSNESGVKS